MMAWKRIQALTIEIILCSNHLLAVVEERDGGLRRVESHTRFC